MLGNLKLAPAVILSIDSASTSGAVISEPSISSRGTVSDYDNTGFGLVKTQASRRSYVEDALYAADDLGVALVIVGEEWTSHGISNAAYASLCESWGKWLAAVETVTGQEELEVEVHVIRVNPNTWRAAVLGKNRPKKSSELKSAAIAYCHRALGVPNLCADLADAMCMRVWASRSELVHSALATKKSKKKKSAKKSRKRS